MGSDNSSGNKIWPVIPAKGGDPVTTTLDVKAIRQRFTGSSALEDDDDQEVYRLM